MESVLFRGGKMKRIAIAVLLIAAAIMPAAANTIEISDAEGGLWIVCISDQEIAVPDAGDIVEAGSGIPADLTIMERGSFEEGLEYLSSSLAARILALLQFAGPESTMGSYMYEGEEGRYAMLTLASPDNRANAEAAVACFLGSLDYDSSVMSFSDM